jgi:membrane associated rhomboid family serine protease
LNKFFWEFPLTSFMCIFLTANYILLELFVPHKTIALYFYSYPGHFNPVNWILSSTYHGSVGHLLSNMVFLFILGRVVEDKLGKGKWILFYIMAGFISAMGDSIIRKLLNPFETIPTVGASGAICGISIVAALISPYNMKILGRNLWFPTFLLAWTMIYSDLTNLFARDNIAHWAHIGGYTSVFFTAYMVNHKDRKDLKQGFLLNVLFFGLSMILLYIYENR